MFLFVYNLFSGFGLSNIPFLFFIGPTFTVEPTVFFGTVITVPKNTYSYSFILPTATRV